MADFILLAIPYWFLVLLGICTAIFMVGIIIRYRYICLTRWDWLVILVGVAGIIALDIFLLVSTVTASSVDSATAAAISRVMRLILLSGLFWVLHSSARRQRDAWKLERDILDDRDT
jgi:hypothetical protein